MPLIQLSKARQSSFRRVVRDAAGTIIREYVWEKPGEVLDIPPEDLPVIIDDLPKTLVPVVQRPGSPGKFDEFPIDLDKLRAAIAEADEDEGEPAPGQPGPAESVVITAGDVGDVGGIVTDSGVAAPDPELTTVAETSPDGTDIPRRRRRTRD